MGKVIDKSRLFAEIYVDTLCSRVDEELDSQETLARQAAKRANPSGRSKADYYHPCMSVDHPSNYNLKDGESWSIYSDNLPTIFYKEETPLLAMDYIGYNLVTGKALPLCTYTNDKPLAFSFES